MPTFSGGPNPVSKPEVVPASWTRSWTGLGVMLLTPTGHPKLRRSSLTRNKGKPIPEQPSSVASSLREGLESKLSASAQTSRDTVFLPDSAPYIQPQKHLDTGYLILVLYPSPNMGIVPIPAFC